MKVIIENIGVFKYAEYDLSDLTIICGKNNTGKTYATYCLYGFLDYFRNGYYINIANEKITELLANGTISIPIDASQKAIDTYMQEACHKFSKILPRVFAAQDKYFENSQIHVKIDAKELSIPETFENSYRTDKKEFLQIVKSKGNNELMVSMLSKNTNDKENMSLRLTLSHIIGDALKEIFFSNILKDCFIASAERTGAVIFKDELNVRKNTTLRGLTHDSDMDIEDIMNKIYNTAYALPVRRNIDFIRNLDSISKNESELCKSHPEIITEFQNIAGGIYKVSKEGLFFYPNASKTTKLSIGESASSVRALLDVFFYLKHVARQGQILMIDEPELNLHPECQRKFARLLAKLVNYGIQVFITTHSDYIIKEFNTLLMFHARRGNSRVAETMNKFGYQNDELLSLSQIRMYISDKEYVSLPGSQKKTKIQTLIPATIDPSFGIEAVSFDDTINEMNEIQESIMFGYGHVDA